MDTALQLRQQFDAGQPLTSDQISAALTESDLVRNLTDRFEPSPLFAVWRLLALAEIPGANELDYTRRLADWAMINLATDQGFSIMGGADALLPCYNAMLVAALSRLGYANHPAVQAGVNWIVTYQPFDRQTRSTWTGKGVKKYGGCLKSTPCYIGLAKSVKALLAFRRSNTASTPTMDACIAAGVETILQHRLLYRLSQDTPITPHILDISFPESYHLNILELLQTIEWAGRLTDPRCRYALEYLQGRKKAGAWRVSFRYKSAGYVCFDPPSAPADWVTYLIGRYLNLSSP